MLLPQSNLKPDCKGVKYVLNNIMSLLDKFQSQVKESNTNVEIIAVNVTAVITYKDTDKLILDTDKGRFFVFKNSINGIENPLALPQRFKANITLVEKGEYVNVTAVNIELDSLGKYNFVAAAKIAVQL
jgi:hypothetical protein